MMHVHKSTDTHSFKMHVLPAILGNTVDGICSCKFSAQSHFALLHFGGL